MSFTGVWRNALESRNNKATQHIAHFVGQDLCDMSNSTLKDDF